MPLVGTFAVVTDSPTIVVYETLPAKTVNNIYKAPGARRTSIRAHDTCSASDNNIHTQCTVCEPSSGKMSEQWVENLEHAVGEIKTQVKDVNSQVRDLCKKLRALIEISSKPPVATPTQAIDPSTSVAGTPEQVDDTNQSACESAHVRVSRSAGYIAID